MHLKTCIFSLILSLSMIGCRQADSNVAIDYLTGNRIKEDSSHLRSYPKKMVGDTLISKTTSSDANYCVSVFRNDSLITLGTIFTKGNGAGEYHSVNLGFNSKNGLKAIEVTGSSSVIRRYESNHISFFIKPSQKNDVSAYGIPDMISMRYVTDNFVNTDDSTVLITGAPYKNPEHIFSLVNLKKVEVTPLDFWPEDGYKGKPLPKQSVYTDNAVILAGGNRYLYKCGEERYAFIFEVVGNKIKILKELFQELPDYQESSDGLNYDLRSRSIHRMDCDASDERIYILMIEKNSSGSTASNWIESNCGDEVRVYDWDGNIKAIYILDKIGSNIKVNNNNKTLYLFNDNPVNGEREVYSYSINIDI